MRSCCRRKAENITSCGTPRPGITGRPGRGKESVDFANGMGYNHNQISTGRAAYKRGKRPEGGEDEGIAV